MMQRKYTVLCPFGGLGAGALGFLQAQTRLFETEASFRLLGGIDLDPEACRDFEYLTGVPEWCTDIHDVTAEQLRERFGREGPDIVFLSPPCTGSSGLLSGAKSKTSKYRKLNKLSLTWTKVMLEAWATKLPRLVLLENVPRITTRAGRMLGAVRAMLRKAGYVIHEDTHDAGELGGLAQHRRRYLLVARHAASTSSLLYQPVKKRVRACGEVLGPLPIPGDPEAGPMHALPRIGWLNWVRLAMIPAGGDWRDLPGVLEQGQQRRELFKRSAVEDWQRPVGTIGGPGTNGVENVADPRVHGIDRSGPYGVVGWDKPASTVAAAGQIDNTPASVADPRIERFRGSMGVRDWRDPAATVPGESLPSNGAQSVADPRVRLSVQDGQNVHHNKYRVEGWDDAAHTVIGATRPGSGAASVADPRARAWFSNVLRVVPWEEPARTVTGGNGPTNGGGVVADPRVGASEDWNRGQGYGVVRWDAPAATIAAGSHPGQGKYAVADPRPTGQFVGLLTLQDAIATVTGAIHAPFAIVDPRSDGAPIMVVRDARKAPPAPPVILAADGTWHRPLTTLELAVLQGLPTHVDGKPLLLSGTSTSEWRRRIGNAVPVQAATAIAEQMLLTMLSSDLGAFSLSSAGGAWVAPAEARESAALPLHLEAPFRVTAWSDP